MFLLYMFGPWPVDLQLTPQMMKLQGSRGLVQGEYSTTRNGLQSRAPDSGDLLRYLRFT
jgi:hypothetical protein